VIPETAIKIRQPREGSSDRPDVEQEPRQKLSKINSPKRSRVNRPVNLKLLDAICFNKLDQADEKLEQAKQVIADGAELMPRDIDN